MAEALFEAINSLVVIEVLSPLSFVFTTFKFHNEQWRKAILLARLFEARAQYVEPDLIDFRCQLMSQI